MSGTGTEPRGTGGLKRTLTHRHPSVYRIPRGREEAVADRANGYFGAMRWVKHFLLITVGWCAAGSVLSFDRYPFQAYTFAVSVLAILMTSLVLIAGNRQAAADRAHQDHAFEQVERLLALQEEQMRRLDELAVPARSE